MVDMVAHEGLRTGNRVLSSYCAFFYLFKAFVYKQTIHDVYWVTQKLPQTYTAKHATFPMGIRKIIVQICRNFWGTQYFIGVQP